MMKENKKCSIFVFFACGIIAGCKTISSAEVSTQAMYPDVKIFSPATDRSPWIAIWLHKGDSLNNELIKLSSGDTLSVKANGRTLQVEPRGWFGGIHYDANLPNTPKEVKVEFALNRKNHQSVPLSTIVLPAEVKFQVPKSASRSKPLFISWEHNNKAKFVEFRVRGDCVSSYSKKVSDSGSHTIPAGALKQKGNNKTCNVTINVERINEGQLATAWGAGLFEANRNQEIKFVSTK